MLLRQALKLLTVLALVATLVAPMGGAALASTTSPPVVDRSAVAATESMGLHRVFLESLARNLNISTDQLIAHFSAGMSLRDIAATHGLDDRALAQAIRGAVQDTVNHAVDQQKLTRDQATTIMNVVNGIDDTHLVNISEMMAGHARGAMHGHMKRG